ncbi:hypothetical protein [Streptomyces sp. NPDC005385]|uniref:hypothetical protein n=1 Tax=Streptomyces sp. NPDC005385 TaxID=3157039 RepID=UPI0033AE38EE
MTARPTFRMDDIVPLLQAGLSDSEIGRRLFHHRTSIALVREALRFPPARLGPAVEPLSVKFVRHTKSVEGGHLQWVGPRTQDLVPVLSHGTARRLTARQVAYRMERGRKPSGIVKSACVHPWCVAPAHQADEVDRDRERCQAPQLDAASALLGGP